MENAKFPEICTALGVRSFQLKGKISGREGGGVAREGPLSAPDPLDANIYDKPGVNPTKLFFHFFAIGLAHFMVSAFFPPGTKLESLTV